ncbi:MAG: hypothetical protein RLZZ303_3243 [Candidatus Hydrogenedentota bacterium]
MSINLQPFYEAVALYALDRWLPLATGAMVLAMGLLIVIQAASSRKNDWLAMLTGLLGAFSLPATALSILALLHTRGPLWHEQLQVAVVEKPTHWWFALALAASILLAMIFAGLRRSKSLGTAAGVLLGLTLALQIPLFIAGYVLTRYYWWPMWTNFLYYAVPIAATVVVAISTGCYMVRRAAPAAKGLNAFYQGVTLVMLVWLAYLGMGTYFNWGNWRYGAFVNAYEFYHYYIGAKYSPEVGYYHMYNATLVADAETGDPFNKTQIRNLTTGVKVNSSDVLKEAETYKAMFDTPRWQEFMADIRWFKTKLVPSRFSAMIGDKGYNATPVWTMLVRGILCQNISPIDTPPAIVEYPMRAYRGFMAWIFGQDIYPDTANKLPEGEPNGMLFLALLDVILIVAATAAVVWAFGIRAALLMLIVLGTSYVMKYSHMKGAFLRTDFTMSLIIGICMLKKDRYAAAGSFIAYSCLSRVFPAVFFFGMGAKLAWHGIARVPQFLRETGAPGIAAAALAAVAGLAGGALVLGPKIIARLEAMPKAALPDTVPLDLPRWAELGLQAGFAVAAAGFLVVGLVILWGWRTRNVPRRYLWFFSSATATVVILVTAAFFYHSAVKPAHQPLNYMDKIGKEGTFARSVGNFLSRNFDGGLTVFGEYAQKIGKHNTDISPWRVGFKYWFIGVGSKRPLWAGWTRAEKGETQWLEGGLAMPNPDAPFLDGLMKELRGPNEAVRATAEFEKMRNSGSFERIRFRDPDTGFWNALWTEFKDNKVITRSGIHRIEKHGIYNLILILVLALSFFLVPAFKDHEATAWSFVVVFFLVSATYYYFIMLLVPLLFFSPYANRPTRALGVMALLMAAWVGYALYTPPVNWKQEFSQYYYHSVMYFVLVLYMMLLGAGASLRLLWRTLRGAVQHRAAA